MAWHQTGAKPSPESMMTYFQLNPQEHISIEFANKKEISCQESAFKNAVCEIAAILFRP